MRGSRTKLKDKAKVIVEKLKNPDDTLREIEEKTGINRETSRKILNTDLKEVVQSSDILKNIIENDLETVNNMSEIAKKFTRQLKSKEEIEKSDIATANTITDSSFKRHQLLSGGATDRVDVITDIIIN